MSINYHSYLLDNGLRILVHTDISTPLLAVNLLYDVGSKDENPSMTGFAHLFEHLMFGGTENVSSFDNTLQRAGGESNAFTNCDFTNYYITLPAINAETALWLEADRMRGPNLSDRSIEIQKSVVTEEFRQRYINQPYGDAMLNLRPLLYRVHPYRWPTIGMDITHIGKADHQSLREFFKAHYSPGNAILTIAGNIKPEKAIRLASKWFDSIESPAPPGRNLPEEPPRTGPSRLTLERSVPADAIYRAWIICRRDDPCFHVFDMITDTLSGGDSGRLYTSLVRDRRIFSDINAFVTAEIEQGMLLITGHVAGGISPGTAEEALDEEIYKLATNPVPEREIQKVRNRYESAFHISHTALLQRATDLSLFGLLGDPSMINRQVQSYRKVTPEMVTVITSAVLREDTAATLWYRKNEETARQ
jgi:predicted Zn-dependent peptidase